MAEGAQLSDVPAGAWYAVEVDEMVAAGYISGYEDGMTVFDLMGRFSTLLERPFAIRWTPHTPKFMLGGLVIYAFALVLSAFHESYFRASSFLLVVASLYQQD